MFEGMSDGEKWSELRNIVRELLFEGKETEVVFGLTRAEIVEALNDGRYDLGPAELEQLISLYSNSWREAVMDIANQLVALRYRKRTP